MPLQLPAQIGKYELEEFLGGGMSHVYRARDTVIGRAVAVKILTDEGGADPEAKARFLQEARLAGNVSHENVINTFDYGEDSQGRPFMVMEFLRGEDLRHAMKGGHTGGMADKIGIALQLARALEYVHSLEITHRDIKPENVHVTPNGTVKLMDFGIAKTAGLSMTRAGFVMGTPYYMAPEQVLGKEITPLVDVYAFGILLYELLAGVKPMSADTVDRIFYSILNEPIDPEKLRQAGVPSALIDLVARCTAKDPAQRPQTFSVIAEELAGIRDQKATGPVAPPPPVPAAPKSRAPLWIGLAVALLLAAGLGVWLTRTRKPPSSPAAKAALPITPPVLPARIALPSGDMVLIPAGPFLSGRDRQPITLPDYYIDLTEVTNAAYRAFSNATGYPLPAGFPQDKPGYPVVNVSIGDARQFAHWAGKRLPNAHEWEKAARGPDGWLFPWGEQPDAGRANVYDNKSLAKHELMPVDGFADGASPYRILQTVGNAWELVDEPVKPSPGAIRHFAELMKPAPGPDEPWYAMRGESFEEPLQPGAVFDYSPVPARWTYDNIGFRCARNP
jgi:serine/threonine protein kinase